MNAVDICNLALSHIGERSDINSIDPPERSTEAQACARFWPLARRTMLAFSAWSFATKRVDAADLSPGNTVPYAWQYAYAVPSDSIKVLGVYAPGEWRDEVDTRMIAHEIGSDGKSEVIYCNVTDGVIRYIFDQTDTTKYSPMFLTAVSYMLAGFLAGPIIKGAAGINIAQSMQQGAMAWAAKAAAEDANQSASRAIFDDQRHQAPWITARGAVLPPWGNRN